MRSQLLVSGVLVILLGAALYILQVPLADAWSLVFIAGGAVMVIASPFVSESPGPVKAPAGYHFCRFCSAAVAKGAERCPQCNGLQLKEGA